MIEVEKKFQTTEEQWARLFKDATSVTKKILHDRLYDFPDYRLFKEGVKLRNRNGSFELKIKKSDAVHNELENKQDIEKYFNTSNLEKFIDDNMILIAEYNQDATLLEIGEFNVDSTKVSYGYDVSEIELLVHSDAEVEEAENKIDAFARKYNLEFKNLPGKLKEYFRVVKPEVYKMLYE